MTLSSLDRRMVMRQGLALASALTLVSEWGAAAAVAGEATEAPKEPSPPPFTFDAVKAQAKTLSETEFSKPAIELPEPFNKLGYDQYRDIRYRSDQAIWKGDKADFEIQLFPMGWLYDMPVDIWVVDQALGQVNKLSADGRLFTLGPLVGPGPEAAPFGFSGFRIHAPINRADYFDEFVVFQGASYLRGVGRGQAYGSSARGLAINTARPGGEEFPFFRTFWLEKPKAGATSITVFALLDSPSTTGAYRFTIQPGEATVMDVDVTLYPRKALEHVGLAPLTSMFLHGPADQRMWSDFRPAVHDSEGLAMLTGSGERLWRPLTNPKTLQTSAFMDKDPKGFGLSQRDRSFQNYQDLEARYEHRPTTWVETKGPWGEGYVELIEIPVEDEIHDNVVAYWRPSKPIEAGAAFDISYRLYWSEQVPVAWTGARVATTRIGKSKKPETFLFVIDFDGTGVKDLRDLPVAEVTANPGAIGNVVVQRNPEISGIRVSFELTPESAELVELRAVLKSQDQVLSETWLYRWTKP
jgi:glucans biosynthesis protein